MPSDTIARLQAVAGDPHASESVRALACALVEVMRPLLEDAERQRREAEAPDHWIEPEPEIGSDADDPCEVGWRP